MSFRAFCGQPCLVRCRCGLGPGINQSRQSRNVRQGICARQGSRQISPLHLCAFVVCPRGSEPTRSLTRTGLTARPSRGSPTSPWSANWPERAGHPDFCRRERHVRALGAGDGCRGVVGRRCTAGLPRHPPARGARCSSTRVPRKTHWGTVRSIWRSFTFTPFHGSGRGRGFCFPTDVPREIGDPLQVHGSSRALLPFLSAKLTVRRSLAGRYKLVISGGQRFE